LIFLSPKSVRIKVFLLKVLSDEIRDAFIDYEWPNNVRELKTAIARLVKYNPKNHVITEVDDEVLPILKAPVKAHLSSEIPFVNDFSIELKDRVLLVEREMMLAEIKRLKGNKSKAAKVMGISREALRKKLLQSDEVLERLGKHNLIELSSQKVNLDEEKDAA
jgi:two-component system response regulator HydG